MTLAIKQRVTIEPGGVVRVTSPHFTPGAAAEVIVLVEAEPTNGDGPTMPAPHTWASFIGSGRGLFKSVEEIDAYIRELRDEWDR